MTIFKFNLCHLRFTRMESINAILRVKWLQKKCIIFTTHSPCNVNYIQNIHRCDWKQFVRILRFSSEKKATEYKSNKRKILLDVFDGISIGFEFGWEGGFSKEEERFRGDNFQKGTLSSQSMLITRPGWQTRTSLKFLWANVWARRRFRPFPENGYKVIDACAITLAVNWNSN